MIRYLSGILESIMICISVIKNKVKKINKYTIHMQREREKEIGGIAQGYYGG